MRSVWLALPLVMFPASALAQVATPPAAELPPPPRALPAALTPQPGGMTADQAAERAVRTSAQVRAAHANTEAADSARTEAALAMVPQIALSARYTRLSEITPPRLSLGSSFCVNPQNAALYVGRTRTAADGPAPNVPGQDPNVVCLNPRDSVPPPPSGGGFAFPVILDQFAFRGTLTVPLTDIPFRLARVYEAAGLTHEARRFDEEAARAQAAADARIAFYEFMRAQGQTAVAEQGVESARRHREDLARFVEAGTVARVELLRVEAQLAETERMLIMAREGLSLAETQLRQRLHLEAGERVTLGEALDAPVQVTGNVQDMIDRAWHARPELASLERQTRALDANLAATRAGMFPSLVAQANLDVANPNQRFIPQTQEFNTTWDATIQLQWSPTGALQTGATASRIASQRDAVRAQLQALREGLELEVRSAWTNVQGARAAIDAAARQVAAAEESYRVRRERFVAGAAISSELTDAELDLLRARLAIIDANVNLRESLARLRRATGTREAAR